MSNDIAVIMGTGPLGLWTAAALASNPQTRHWQIRMGNTRGKPPAWLPPDVHAAAQDGRLTWHGFDALDAAQVQAFAQGASVLVHCAIPDYDMWVGRLPTIQRNAIDAALANQARLICADNLYAYAPVAGIPMTEDTAEIPPSKKGQLRKDMLDLMRQAQAQRGLQWATVQGSQYFGPGASGQSVFGDWFIKPAMQGKTVRFVGNPALPHAWAYAPDFGRAMALLAMGEADKLLNRPWIVPHVSHLPANELAQQLFTELDRQKVLPAGATRKTAPVPKLVLWVLGLFNPVIKAREEMLYQFQMDFRASGAQLTAATGLQTTPLEQAVAETVAFWKATRT